MKGLLYKEFITGKIGLIVIAVIQFLLSVTTISMAIVGQTGAGMFLTSVSCYFLIFSIFGMLSEVFFRNDENRTWCNFASALPQTSKGQVACKYYVILIITFGILCCCLLTDCVVIAIVGDGLVSATKATFLIFCCQLILRTIDIPFKLRFGSTSGRVVKDMVLVMILLIMGVYLLFGDISFLFEGNIMENIMLFLNSSNVYWIIAFIMYVMLCAYYLSYRISLKMYQKGSENYEY